jgi:hypothetical protein
MPCHARGQLRAMSGMRRSHDISRPSLSPAFPRLGRCTTPRCCRPSACPSRHAPFAHLHTVVLSYQAHSTPPPLRLSQGIRSEPTLTAVSAIRLMARRASESKAACRGDEQTSRREEPHVSKRHGANLDTAQTDLCPDRASSPILAHPTDSLYSQAHSRHR